MARYTLTQRQVQPLTLEEARVLSTGTTLYSLHYRNADGTSARAKVTSVKTWKTRPTEVLVGWKHGLYTFGHETETTINQWSLEPEWSFQETPQPTETPNG